MADENGNEETVKEAEAPQGVTSDDVVFAFSVVKLNDGKVLVQAIEDLEPSTPDEIYAACTQVLRTLDTQNIAGAIHAAMLAAAEEAQKPKSKLVIPT